MGRLSGHVLPGSCFIVFGLWWTLQIFHRYYRAKKNSTKFISSAIFGCGCLCGRLRDWPIEAYAKIFCTTVGFLIEIRGKLSKELWGPFCAGHGQHATMYFFFGLTGVFDLLLHYRVRLPRNMNYVSMIMAFAVEFILFRFHIHGRQDLDEVVHTLLLSAIAACIMGVILELKCRDNIMCALSRGYFTLLQGSWFWQVGWILYPPFENSYKWDWDDHEHTLIATTIFTWHVAANLLVVLAIGGIVACVHRKIYSYKLSGDGLASSGDGLGSSTDGLAMSGDGLAMKRLLMKNKSSAESVVPKNDDSDSEKDVEKPLLS